MTFLSLISAHLVGDFYLQTDQMVTNKKNYLGRHLFHHFVVTLVTLIILSLIKNISYHILYQIIIPTCAVVFFHYLIDKLKILLSQKQITVQQPLLPFYLFIIDQVLHGISLWLIYLIFFNPQGLSIIRTRLAILHLTRGGPLHLTTMTLIIYLFVLFIVSTTVSGHAIRLLLGSLPNHLNLFEGKVILKDFYPSHNPVQKDNKITEEYSYLIAKKQDLSRGKIIGYFERLLVIILVVYGAFTAIAFIITAKSLARFKQMDDRDFAEYFLLGTLSSIFLGIIYGLITRLVLL